MYTDTKKNYENIIQTNVTNPQLSSLHLKLRIQKDRLVAWGLEWADSNADQSDDIDGSLDRAGISDLVASIMSSIRELLDEAERIQPQSRPQIPGGYPIDKAGLLVNTPAQWTPANLVRLEDIVKDITTSIDTLCDLSKSQQQILRHNSAERQYRYEKELHHYNGSEKAPLIPSPCAPSSPVLDDETLQRTQSKLISSTRIDPNDIIYPNRSPSHTETPPSYNATATDRGNRIFAFLRSSRELKTDSSSSGKSHHTPVLVDYYSEDGANPRHGPLPSLQRYEDLVLALQGSPRTQNLPYTGSLVILGWFADPHNSRYAFVYEIPTTSVSKIPTALQTFQPPQSLLSFLQNSGVEDSSNVPCLEDRMRLALNLVSNLLHTHAKGLTHRNINSNNIVFAGEGTNTGTLSKPWKEGTIRKPLLVSWDQCNEDTPNSAPETLISNIYRHPGIEHGQRSNYRPAHDIYSLGLVLLEVGLWMPLNKLWKTKYARSDFKARLQAIYAPKLAAKCGSSYMSAVDHCLSAVDKDNAAHAQARATSRDRQSKVRNDYYWNVVKPLEKCCMMDTSDEPRVVPAPRSESPKESQDDRACDIQHITVTDSTEAQQILAQTPLPWLTTTAYSPTEPGGKTETSIWNQPMPADTRAYFDTVLFPKLNRMFAKAINRWESYDLFCSMIGPTFEMARPTILMVCKSMAKAWKILSYVNEDKKLFDIYVAPGQIRRSKGKKKKKVKKATKEADQPGQHPSRYQQKPTCGASIGCFVDEQHSEAVTFGGIVLVNDEAHGMSVHHMLEDPDSGVDMGDFEGSETDDLPDSDDVFADFSIDEDVSDYDTTLGEDGFDMGDVPGTDPGKGQHIIVTQPALDDVDPDYFPSQDEMSDDHLVIHGLGTIHASSGLRRTTYEDVQHEVDWALFKIHDDRKPSANAIDGGIKHCKRAADAFYPAQVIQNSALGGLEVHAFGSTSGLETGTIASMMQMTKMPGRVFASPVWRVKGNFGVGGDSGAWVIDNASGGVCGHVTAYSETMEYATIAPMEVLLHDIEQTLGTSVALPAIKTDAECLSFKHQLVDMPGPEPTQLQKLSGARRRSSLDSGCGSEIERIETGVTTPPESPVFATSPRSPTKTPALSLNNVAEKWESSKRNSGERCSKDEKLRETVHVREGVQAKC